MNGGPLNPLLWLPSTSTCGPITAYNTSPISFELLSALSGQPTVVTFGHYPIFLPFLLLLFVPTHIDYAKWGSTGQTRKVPNIGCTRRDVWPAGWLPVYAMSLESRLADRIQSRGVCVPNSPPPPPAAFFYQSVSRCAMSARPRERGGRWCIVRRLWLCFVQKFPNSSLPKRQFLNRVRAVLSSDVCL